MQALMSSPESCAFHSDLRDTPEKHKKNATLDFFISVNGGKETVDEVLVKVLIQAHVVSLVPLGGSHLILDILRSQLFAVSVLGESSVVLTLGSLNRASQEGHAVVEVSDTQGLQAPNSFALFSGPPVP